MAQKHFLERIFDTGSYTREEQDAVLSAFSAVHFDRNSYLLREGQVAQQYWFLESGFVRSYAVDPTGKDISTGFFTVADIVIDWSSFMLKIPSREYFQALTPCTCWQIGYDTFQQLFHHHKAFREQGRARLAAGYFGLKEYSISMIADQAKDRYRQLLQQKPEIIQHVSLKHIATYLGITDTSLSRIRKELASERNS